MKTLQERFWVKVRKTDKCWEWNGCTLKNGYGQIKSGEKLVYAHRLSFSLNGGILVTGLTIDHLCRNRRCVNPAHLEQVTSKENSLRGRGVFALNAKKTSCKWGHPLEGRNVRFRPTGGRTCRICVRDWARADRKRKRV